MIVAPASGLYEFDPQYIANIPAVLQAHLQWVVWQAGDRIAKRTGLRSGLEKKPIDPKTNPPRLAASDNPASWGAFQQCVEALPHFLALWQQQAPKNYRGGGIGFVFSKHSAENEGEQHTDLYTGVDLDHCRTPETGAIAPWAHQIIAFLNSYSEVSPSGTGVKIFVQATLPRAGVNKHFIEIYDRGRFFTVTGWHVPGTPMTIEPRQSHIEALYAVHDLLDRGLQRYGERLSLLFAGHWEQVQPAPGLSTYRSQSEADLAFCALLARGGATAEQIDTLMRLSGLYRPKWDEKHGAQTYGVLTLAKAMGRGDLTPQDTNRFQNTMPQQHNEQHQPPAATARSIPWDSPVPFDEFTLPAFPITVLPEPLQSYVVALAQATQTPFDLAGMLVLAVCACALAKKVVVCIRPSYVEPVNLFVAVILPPGNRKSTVFAEVIAPVQAFEEAEAQRMEALIAATESQYRIAEKTLQ
jgi:hypothetical protein